MIRWLRHKWLMWWSPSYRFMHEMRPVIDDFCGQFVAYLGTIEDLLRKGETVTGIIG